MTKQYPEKFTDLAEKTAPKKNEPIYIKPGSQKRDLIRAALYWQEFHWMDTFLIFPTWLKKKQSGNYLSLFRTIAARVHEETDTWGVSKVKLERCKDTGLWRLEFPHKKRPVFNIDKTIKLLEQSNEFLRRKDNSGWDLVMQACKDGANPRNIWQALIYANEPLKDESEFYDIKELLVKYRKKLVTAIAIVSRKASSGVQGLSFQNTSDTPETLARWIVEIININNVLELFSGITISEPEQENAEIVTLVDLLNNLKEATDGSIKNLPVEMAEAIRKEASDLLDKLYKHPIVQNAVKDALDFIESLSYGNKNLDNKEWLRDAMGNFIFKMQGTLSLRTFNVGQFYKYIRIFAENYNTRNHVLNDICNPSDLLPDEKEKVIFALLKEIVQEEELTTSVVEEIAGVLKGAEQGIDETKADDADQLVSHKQNRLDDIGKTASSFVVLKERLEPKYNRYPSYEDFKTGNYYRNDRIHDDIADILRKNRRCLIIGNPGCGKTTCALAIGHEFSKRDNFSVLYHDATTESEIGDWEKVLRLSDEKTLVILDNIHARCEDINNLLCSTDKHSAMLLVTSRRVHRRITLSQHPDGSSNISYLDIFQSEKALKKLRINEDMIRNIVNRYVRSREISKDDIGDLTSLIEKCEGDLNILHFCIQTWERNDCSGCLSDIKETMLFDDIYSSYLEHNPYQKELLNISALSKLEIDVDSKWIKVNLDRLEGDGLIQLVRRDEIESDRYVSWFRVYHPSAAGYFLKATAYRNPSLIKSVDQYTLECLNNYIDIAPCNFFRVFHKIYVSGQEKLDFKILNDSSLNELATRIIKEESIGYIQLNLIPILNYLLGLIKNNKRKKDWIVKNLFMPLLKRISTLDCEAFGLWPVGVIFQVIGQLKIDIKLLPLDLNFNDLGKHARENKVGLKTLRLFFLSAHHAGISKDKVATFCNNLDFEDLGRQACHTSVTTIKGFVELVRKAGTARDKTSLFYNKIDFRTLGQRAREGETGLASIKVFIEQARKTGISKDRIHTFFDELDYHALGKKSREDQTGLVTITLFLALIRWAGISKEQVFTFCTELDFRALARQARDSGKRLTTLSKILALTHWARISRDHLYVFCKELDFHYIGKCACKNKTSLTTIMNFIKGIRRVGITGDQKNIFCEELDYCYLGKHAREIKTGSSTIKYFIGELGCSGVFGEKSVLFYEAYLGLQRTNKHWWDMLFKLKVLPYNKSYSYGNRQLKETSSHQYPEEFVNNGINSLANIPIGDRSWPIIWDMLWNMSSENKGGRELEDLCLDWLNKISCRETSWPFLWTQIQGCDFKDCRRDQFIALGVRWLENINIDHKLWHYIWKSLWNSEIDEDTRIHLSDFAAKLLTHELENKAWTPWGYVWQDLWNKEDVKLQKALVTTGKQWLKYVDSENDSLGYVWQKIWHYSDEDICREDLSDFTIDWLKKEVLFNNRHWTYLWNGLWSSGPDNKTQIELIKIGVDWLQKADGDNKRWGYIWIPIWKHGVAKEAILRIGVDWFNKVSLDHVSWPIIWLHLWKSQPADNLYKFLVMYGLRFLKEETVLDNESWGYVWQSLWADKMDGTNKKTLIARGLYWLDHVKLEHISWQYVWCDLRKGILNGQLLERLNAIGINWLFKDSFAHKSWPFVWTTLWREQPSEELRKRGIEWLKETSVDHLDNPGLGMLLSELLINNPTSELLLDIANRYLNEIQKSRKSWQLVSNVIRQTECKD